jgi:hypothetical protein
MANIKRYADRITVTLSCEDLLDQWAVISKEIKVPASTILTRIGWQMIYTAAKHLLQDFEAIRIDGDGEITISYYPKADDAINGTGKLGEIEK